MEFNDHKPIYLQIADTVCDKIVSGEWNAEDRVPSVRELGMTLGVNPNTIMRSYEYLQTINVIYNKMWEEYELTPNNVVDYQRPENVQLTQRKVNTLSEPQP